MKKPKAAEVATACRTGTLPRSMKGTDKKAPPAPSRPDTKPIKAPMAAIQNGAGKERPCTGADLRAILEAEYRTNTPNTIASAVLLIMAKIAPPDSSPPRIRPGTMTLTTSQRMAPCLWCALTLDKEVNKIVAMAVAREACTASSCGNPNRGSGEGRNGS